MQLINILIRTCGRRELFLRCINSIIEQNYPNIRVIVSVDRPGIDYIPDWCEVITVTPDKSKEYFYDLYLNDLKALVTDGYFLIADDDDLLAPNVLNELVLDAPAILCQINHLGRILPQSANFGFAQIGFPCLILHHTLNNLATISGGDHSDWHYISEIQSKIDLKFVPIVLVICDVKSNGK